VLSGDGLLLGRSQTLDRDSADHLAAIASAFQSLSRGVGTRCTWSPRDGRWALKFVNQACVLHRDDQVEHG